MRMTRVFSADIGFWNSNPPPAGAEGVATGGVIAPGAAGLASGAFAAGAFAAGAAGVPGAGGVVAGGLAASVVAPWLPTSTGLLSTIMYLPSPLSAGGL